MESMIMKRVGTVVSILLLCAVIGFVIGGAIIGLPLWIDWATTVWR